jgi:hypothetical protein
MSILSKSISHKPSYSPILFYFIYFSPDDPISDECVAELARSLQTTILERLEIKQFFRTSFEVLAPSLPKTLVYLDLNGNRFRSEVFPIFRSYLKSNGDTLKVLVLDGIFIKEYLEEPDLSSLSTAKIVDSSDWQANFFRQEEPLRIQPQKMNDSDWSMLFTELTKDLPTSREVNLCLPDEFDRNNLNYIKTFFGEQFPWTNLTISGNLSDTIIQTELFQQLKENNSITKLRIVDKIDSNVFNELKNLLENKNNITHLELLYCDNVRDEDVIMFCHALKTNTTLQSLILNSSEIGDSGFQALLSSLPNSLTQLKVENNVITAKSLPSLLAFMKNATVLNEISLKENGIRSSSLPEVNVPDLVAKILDSANANHCICNLDIQEKVKPQIEKALNDGISISSADFHDDDMLELRNELKKKPEQNWSLSLVGNKRISSIGYDYLADILSSTINIVKLNIYGIDYNKAIRTKFFNSLCDNKTIKEFEVYMEKLDNQDMEYIGRFIQNNSALEKTNLGRCEIDDDGIIHLVKGLPGSSLKLLFLNSNSIGDRGCAAALSSIPPTLKHLDLSFNQITDSSFQTILTFLTTNRTLEILCICSNPIYGEPFFNKFDDIRRQQINEALKQNNICKVT